MGATIQRLQDFRTTVTVNSGLGEPALGGSGSPSNWTDGPYRGTPIVVFGASGFIGRRVARRLAEAGAHVLLAVRDERRAERVLACMGVAGRLERCDVTCTADVVALLRRTRPAVAFNLAGYGVDPRERSEADASRVNADGIAAICEGMAAVPDSSWPGQRIVHVGTALEYGEARGSLSEDTPPRPTTVYGRTKLAGTRALAERCRRLSVTGVTARLFTVYGPGELEGRLLPTLLGAAGHERPLGFTAGVQRRDFTYVDDVAEGLLRLGLAEPQYGTTCNLATGRLTTVREFIEVAARATGLDPARLRFGVLPTRPEEMVHDPVDVSLLESLTGWRPSTPVEDGVRRTVAVRNELRGCLPAGSAS
jgi:nucleoside-diphosphate-sugar epimerase